MLTLRIALRYLLSRKSHGAVNIISGISLAAIAVAAAAMVIVLSVFNGFSQLAESKLSAIDPDYRLVPAHGKAIDRATALADSLAMIAGVETAQPEITEQAFAVAPDAQMPVTLIGMTPEGLSASGLPEITIDGVPELKSEGSALLSVGVALGLNLRPSVGLDSLTVYEPRRVGRINPANPMAAFRSAPLRATGVFQVEQEEYDRDAVVVPFETASMLLSYDGEASSITVWLKPDAPRYAAKALEEFAQTHGLTLENRHMQQQQAFRMISIEKWITFVMLAFILMIASCNIISTLSMLVLEKTDDMRLMNALGGTRRFINGIFQTQGWLIVILGGCGGIIAGALLVLGQQHFGWVKLGATDPSLMSIDVYPVLLTLPDLLTTLLTVCAVALLITPVVPLIRGRRGGDSF